MPTIVVCHQHQFQGFPPTIEGTPLPFDLPGALSADLAIEVPQPGGVPRTHLDCKSGCKWALDLAVEKALRSVGDPTERPTLGQIREHNTQRNGKKEKKVAKTTEPKKRERRRGMTLNRAIGNMQVALRVEGNVLDIPKEQRDAFWQLVDLMKALDETPKGA